MKNRQKIAITVLSIILIILSFGITAYAQDSTPFELPLDGASGFANKEIYFMDDPSGNILKKLSHGTAFTIIEAPEKAVNYLKVELTDGSVGYVRKDYTMINLPDVIPSIVYKDTNSQSSIFRSAEKDIPDVTGMQLYNVKAANPRFGGDVQYVMPILYDMALKVMEVQQEALSNGDCLVIYETYRPFEVQMLVSQSLATLASSDRDVYSALHDGKWSKGWFIGESYSYHQIGGAMDCSLAKVLGTEIRTTGGHSYTVVISYEEYEMPTAMHELSPMAAVLASPHKPQTLASWAKEELAEKFSASEGAMRLQKYCMANGLTPLASEWWHFQDESVVWGGTGRFFLLGGKPDSNGYIPEVCNETSRTP